MKSIAFFIHLLSLSVKAPGLNLKALRTYRFRAFSIVAACIFLIALTGCPANYRINPVFNCTNPPAVEGTYYNASDNKFHVAVSENTVNLDLYDVLFHTSIKDTCGIVNLQSWIVTKLIFTDCKNARKDEVSAQFVTTQFKQWPNPTVNKYPTQLYMSDSLTILDYPKNADLKQHIDALEKDDEHTILTFVIEYNVYVKNASGLEITKHYIFQQNVNKPVKPCRFSCNDCPNGTICLGFFCLGGSITICNGACSDGCPCEPGYSCAGGTCIANEEPPTRDRTDNENLTVF